MERKDGGHMLSVDGRGNARGALASIRRGLEVKMARLQTQARRSGDDPGQWHYRELPASEVSPAVAARARAEVTRAADELGLGYVTIAFFVPEDEEDVEDWHDVKAQTSRAPWKRFTDRSIGGKAEEHADLVWLRPLTDPAALRALARHEVRHIQQYRQLGPISSAADPVAERAWREEDAEAFAAQGD